MCPDNVQWLARFSVAGSERTRSTARASALSTVAKRQARATPTTSNQSPSTTRPPPAKLATPRPPARHDTGAGGALAHEPQAIESGRARCPQWYTPAFDEVSPLRLGAGLGSGRRRRRHRTPPRDPERYGHRPNPVERHATPSTSSVARVAAGHEVAHGVARAERKIPAGL